MSRDCDYPGPGAGFLTFFVIGLLAYALTASDELWPRLQSAVQDTDPAAITREREPRQKAATVRWADLTDGLTVLVPRTKSNDDKHERD